MRAATIQQPHPVDIHVGARIRNVRKKIGLSQMKLAEALGLTFQQVQKYEKGTNRISASKLFETAKYLDKPIAYFFEDLGDGSAPVTLHVEPVSEQAVIAFLATAEGIELAQAFPRCKSSRVRRLIADLCRALADEEAKGVPV